MVNEISNIIIDDELVLNVDTGVIGSKNNLPKENTFAHDELLERIDRVEYAIKDLETSLDPHTTSRLSKSGREGIYLTQGLFTNVIIGMIIALVLIILLV
ncbi:MAG: tetrahydromethanopterin S-methyltransferase subunit B [Methanosphaera stadtmanae]|jgi:tetrahydromethanopterin S-methyltransferase subunit B|nr:tetrahydromethanopterin S-methyltransferase subunit B [Methanosphaera stadtmanae]